MSKNLYPDYIQRLLHTAAAMIGDEEFGPLAAAARCFEILALFPDHSAATLLVQEAFAEPKLIHDMRRTLTRHVDEWDDRPWPERQRQALSYRFTSSWESESDTLEIADARWPADVHSMVEEGRRQLLQDYLTGQNEGADAAWIIFQEALQRTQEAETLLLGLGRLYAEKGYFAESTDVLERYLALQPQALAARRLWVEVRWWRDHGQQVPWIPPTTPDRASRYQRIQARIEPGTIHPDEPWQPLLPYQPPNAANLPKDFVLPAAAVDAWQTAVSDLSDSRSPSPSNAVDWGYLDKLAAGDVDVSELPAWAQYILLDLDNPEQELLILQHIFGHLAGDGQTTGEEEE